MKKIIGRLNWVAWNIFDHTNEPEELWNLIDDGQLLLAWGTAMRLTLRNPRLFLPVFLDSLFTA